MTLVDVLDLWSLPAILRYTRPGDEVRHLVAVGWSGRAAAAILTWRGRIPRRQTSCFEVSLPGIYPIFSREALDFQLGYVEPLVRRLLDSMKRTTDDEHARIARYATIHAWGHCARAFELYFSARTEQCPTQIVAIVQAHFSNEAFARHLNRSGDVVRTYHAGCRTAYGPRRQYYADRSSGSASPIVGLLYFFGVLGEVILSWLVAVARAGWRRKTDRYGSRFDVVALAYQRAPTPGLNDLFWAESLRRQTGRRVLSIQVAELDSAAQDFYCQQADVLIRLRDYVIPFVRTGNLVAVREVARQFVVGMPGAIRGYVWMTLRGRLSPYLGALLIRAEMRTRLATALLGATGARATWAMLEGNELNSLALTLAAGRVGGICFGTTWSMPYAPRIYDALARNHVMFVWGSRQEAIYRASQALPRCYVNTGYPTFRHYADAMPPSSGATTRPEWLAKALAQSARQWVVTFYDNVCANDIIINCHELDCLVTTLLDWMEIRADVLLILKVKHAGQMSYSPALDARVRRHASLGAVVVRDEKADLEVGLAADAVVGISSSTLAGLAAAHGRNCVLYDRHGVLDDDMYPSGLANLIRIDCVSRLPTALDAALSRPFDNGDRGGALDVYADGHGEERVANYMADALALLDAGISPALAEQQALHNHLERWPSRNTAI